MNQILTPSQMRDYVLDNPEMFPEWEGINEYELTKIIMIEHYNITHKIGFKNPVKINWTLVFVTVSFLAFFVLMAFNIQVDSSFALAAGL